MLYHVASKILGWVAAPESVLLIILVIGSVLMWTNWRRAGRLMTAFATLCFVLIASLPLGVWMLLPLEDRFAGPQPLPDAVDGIIVLGGSSSLSLSIARNQVVLNGNAERLTMFATLARRYPEARLVFTGGSNSLLARPEREADIALRLFTELGLDPARVRLERQSRNTWENAVNTHQLVKPKALETWLLITSARHIPRAMGSFRKAGWRVTPVPVDYRTTGRVGRFLHWNLFAGLKTLRLALHEWIGLAVYRALDRSNAVFPAPD
jgi:uncharacterized SAM-binding protein YcdF (DUF218 family)